jgi:hypothetical protein
MPGISWSVMTASRAPGSSPNPAEAPPNRVEMALRHSIWTPDVSQIGWAMQSIASPAQINPSMRPIARALIKLAEDLDRAASGSAGADGYAGAVDLRKCTG